MSNDPTIVGILQRLEVLEGKRKGDMTRVGLLEEHVDILTSSVLKRIWWWLCGFHFRKAGRWRR